MLRLGEVVRRSAAWTLLLGIFVGIGGSGCTTNHDALARRPSAGSSGGGVGGSAGLGGFGNTGNESQGGRVNPDEEPKGDDVLTIVNGVVDAPSVRLCFARLSEDRLSSTLVGSPLPELAYAGATVLTELAELSFADDAIQPWVIAGELSKIADLDCPAAVELAQAAEAEVTPEMPVETGQGGEAGAGGAAPDLEMPSLRARPLAALPAGTVAIGRSILLVLSGCLGGAAYRDPSGAACGADYAPDAPTVQPLVVKLSRELGFDKVGLQGVHASLAMGSADLRVAGDSGRVALVFASSLTFGVIAPRPADTRFTALDVGAGEANYGLQAIGENAEVLQQESWADVLSASGLSELAAARTYTAVLLGPTPHLLGKSWWNPPAFALVDNDPTRE
jgi:hypothetical protein